VRGSETTDIREPGTRTKLIPVCIRCKIFQTGFLLLPVPCFIASYTFEDTWIAGLSLSFLVSIISGSLAVGGVGSAEHDTNSSGGSFGGGGASGSW
jgi:uncharacterized membrane protein YgcG